MGDSHERLSRGEILHALDVFGKIRGDKGTRGCRLPKVRKAVDVRCDASLKAFFRIRGNNQFLVLDRRPVSLESSIVSSPLLAPALRSVRQCSALT